jgi:pyrroline-5-carboxylate reductase
MKISIIGGGNLGASIAEGLAKSGFVAAGDITVTRRNAAKLAFLKNLGIQVGSDNQAAAAEADIVIVAVKPFQILDVLKQLSPVLRSSQIVTSVVTGVSIAEMREAIGKEVVLFRAMPNTAIAIQESMTCIATKNGNAEHKALMTDMFDRLGKSVLVEEDMIQAATVLAACGIAYAMRYIRANAQAGIEIGFSAEMAQLIAAQTVKGAAALLIERKSHPESEIDKVTTPKGCTIVGLNEMEHQGFSSALIKGVISSYDKITEMQKD